MTWHKEFNKIFKSKETTSEKHSDDYVEQYYQDDAEYHDYNPDKEV